MICCADLLEAEGRPVLRAGHVVLESRMDKGPAGPVANVLGAKRHACVGRSSLVRRSYGKGPRDCSTIAGMQSRKAVPSTPVEVFGLQGVPEAGDQFRWRRGKGRHIVEYRQAKQREAALAKTASSGRLTLNQLHAQLRAGEVKELPWW